MGISGHEIARVLGDGAVAGAYTVADPGTGGTIDLKGASFGVCEITVGTQSETRSLPPVTLLKTGVRLDLVFNQSGDHGVSECVIDSLYTLFVEGDRLSFVTAIVNGSMAWVPSNTMSSIKVNSIAEAISNNGVTIDGTIIKDGGVTTTTGLLKITNCATLAALGADQAGAAAISSQITFVTASDGTKGVRLPTCAAGLIYIVYDTVATSGVKIYPATGDDINDGTTNAAVHIEGNTMAIFVGLDDTTWAAIYTAN